MKIFVHRFRPYAIVLLTLSAAALAWLASSPSVVNAETAVTGTAAFPIRNPIDKYVLGKLQAEKIEPSPTCSDEEFLRRVYLDICGSIPPLVEVKSFLGERSSDKREKLVDRLLKSERYGEHWSVMWSDLLREHSNSKPREGTERGSYRDFIQDALNKNVPYDEFARSLIDATGNADEDAAVNFYLRDENNRVETANNISTVFMGTRMACAQCHDHPFDKWTQTDFHSLMAFFGRTNVAIDPYATLVRFEKDKRAPAEARTILEPYFKEAHEKVAAEKAAYKKGADIDGPGNGPGMGMGFMETLQVLQKGGKVMKELDEKLSAAEALRVKQMLLNNGVRKVVERPNGEYRMPNEGDGQNKNGKGGGEIVAPAFPWDKSLKAEGRGSRRTRLAEFVVGSRQFAAVHVNRLWANLFGRGIVDPVDDFRAKNPPSNPELLDWLTEEFIKSKFDTKHMVQLIVNSSAYQRSSMPNASNRSDLALFSHARVRRLTAEQIFDSVLICTGKTNGLTEGAAYGMGMGQQMIGNKIMDAMYGQKSQPVQWAVDLPTPARTGTFMNAFNQPDREQTVCKRDESGSIPQALEMLNGNTVNGAIKGSPLIGQILTAKLAPAQASQEIYMAVLTRLPSSSEVYLVTNRAPTSPTREWLEDVYWALLNAREFTFVK
jgi:hypothetical protein